MRQQHKYEYDAFISHAVEDKIPIANELCAKLERAGLKIWYSGKELGIGDSIEKTIAKGLNRSRYGIVIFSPTYLAKNWTIREFYTLLAKEIEEQKVILPVLYNITLDDLKNKDLLMADRFAVDADKGIDFVVERLVSEIRKEEAAPLKVAWFSWIWVALMLSILANVTLLLKGIPFLSSAMVLPAHVQMASKTPAGAVHTSTLFGEVEQLFRQINACTCDHSGEFNPGSARKTRFVRDNLANARHDRHAYDGLQQPDTNYGKAGSKMTMAVVFQIETPAQSVQGMEGLRETDVTTEDSNGPFIVASNRDHPKGVSPQGCRHTVGLAE